MSEISAKEYLSQYRRLLKIVKQKREQIEAVEDLCEHITADYSTERVQASGTKDKLGQLVSRKADLINELTDLVNEAMDYMAGIEALIEHVEDVDARIILHQRYIEGWKWEEISKENFYSLSTVKRKCSAALRSITIE